MQILDRGVCLKNQRSNRKAIILATHQPRADSNTITSRLQQTRERGGKGCLVTERAGEVHPTECTLILCLTGTEQRWRRDRHRAGFIDTNDILI